MSRSPVVIVGDAGFTAANGVNGGDGSPENPYVIDNWEISTCGMDAIRISDTSAYFVVRNVSISAPPDGCTSISGIVLVNAANGSVENASVSQGFQAGIWVSGGRNVVLRENRIASGGILTGQSSNVTIRSNELTGTAYYLIDLAFTQDIAISGNSLEGPWNGVRAFNVQRLTVADNRLSGTGWAIHLESTSDVVISGNDVSRSGNSAIVLESAHNVTVVENNLSHGGAALLSGSSWSGLAVFHNNIYGEMSGRNAADLFDNGYPSGGNFWSGYQGADECSGLSQTTCGKSDGLGDTPMPRGAAVDRYPLMQPRGLSFGLEASVSPTWCVAPCTVRFGVRVTGGVLPLTYQWRFGDGTTSSLANTAHAFGAAGTYDTRVTVQDAVGARAERDVNLTVEGPGPTAGVMITIHPWALYSSAAGMVITVAVSVLVYFMRIRSRRVPTETDDRSQRPQT